MPLILKRPDVLDLYQRGRDRGWVIPCFCTENLTTTEAVLAAAYDHGKKIADAKLPVTLAVTNLYDHRSQTVAYTHTRDWRVGLELFLAELRVLCGPKSPFRDLSVMIHLDHIQHDLDHELLDSDFEEVSSIMYDASTLPFEQNMAKTRAFVAGKGKKVVVEGACDEIMDATGTVHNEMTTAERAERYLKESGVDMMVANLGTEHRANTANLKYDGARAREIRAAIGPKIVLHGTSSVPSEQVGSLMADGVCKVNIWTALERDASPVLLRDMVAHAAQVAGSAEAKKLRDEGLLGPKAPVEGNADLGHFTTEYRQALVYGKMKAIVQGYLELWYR